jgi:hypothetical protein
MKQITRSLVLASLFVSGSALAVPSSPAVGAPIQPVAPGVAERGIGAQLAAASNGKDVPITCGGSGSSDVKSVGHSMTNNTGHIIPKGTVLHWNTSSKLAGSLTLTADLAPGASAEVIKPGQTNGYTCTAHFFAGPADFSVKWIDWAISGANSVNITVENLNPWTDGEPAMAKIASFICNSTQPLNEVHAQIPAIPAGKSVVVAVAITRPGAIFVAGTANYDGKTIESNKANNTTNSPQYGSQCVPK